MSDSARRPWLKKKRWAAAAVLWLVIAYPLSMGPANYAAVRGWAPEAWVQTAYLPLRMAADRPALREAYVRYVMRWRNAGYRHEGYIVDDPNAVAD